MGQSCHLCYYSPCAKNSILQNLEPSILRLLNALDHFVDKETFYIRIIFAYSFFILLLAWK